MTDSAFIQQVKQAVQQVDLQAEVWLFGSRARGDARPDSDWDFLVLTNEQVDRAFKRQVRDAAFHAASVLLLKEDIRHKAHNGAKAMFELHFIRTGLVSIDWGKFYASLFNDRNDSDYEDFAVFTADDILPLLPQTDEFIGLIKSLIQES